MTNLTAIESAKKEPKKIQLTLAETTLMREAAELRKKAKKVKGSAFFFPLYRIGRLEAKAEYLSDLFWEQVEKDHPETIEENWKYDYLTGCVAPYKPPFEYPPIGLLKTLLESRK